MIVMLTKVDENGKVRAERSYRNYYIAVVLQLYIIAVVLNLEKHNIHIFCGQNHEKSPMKSWHIHILALGE